MIVFPSPTLKLVEVLGIGFSGKGVMPQSLGQAEADHIQSIIWSRMLERNQNQSSPGQCAPRELA